MKAAISIDALGALLGTLDFDCAVCHNRLVRGDFERGKVIALTGPKKPTAAHIHHFYNAEGTAQLPEYEHNMRMLAYAYCCQNDLPTSGSTQ